MSQLSRPYQIALLAVLVFAVAWFAALRPHHPGESPAPTPAVRQATPPAPAPAKQATPPAKRATAPVVKHTTSPARHAAAPTVKHAEAPAKSDLTSASRHSGSSVNAKARHATGTAGSRSQPGVSRAVQVSRDIGEGKTVLLLFWNPQASADIAVRKQVKAVSHSLGDKVAVAYARPREVGSFGTVTRDVNINETPTLLVINPKGEVSTLTGLTDAFAIEQTIKEAKH